MPTLRLETLIEAPVAACFALSLSVDAHTSSMGTSRERAVAGVTAGQLSKGDWVTWQARHFGLPFRMTVGVTSVDAPHRFVDDQLRGPFQSWRHEHLFLEHDEATKMVDQIHFRSPLGPAGALVDRTVLRRYMTRLVEQRNTWLKTTLESGPPVQRSDRRVPSGRVSHGIPCGQVALDGSERDGRSGAPSVRRLRQKQALGAR